MRINVFYVCVWCQGASSLNITRETKVSSGREARRMLGAGSKSHMPTAEELKQCQKHAKVWHDDVSRSKETEGVQVFV